MKANIPPRRHQYHSKSPILEMALTSELRAGQGIGAYQHRQTCKMLQHVAMCTFGQHLQTPSHNVVAFDQGLGILSLFYSNLFNIFTSILIHCGSIIPLFMELCCITRVHRTDILVYCLQTEFLSYFDVLAKFSHGIRFPLN